MAKKKTSKKEALTTRYFITEVLEKELNIPPRNIVNDTTFAKFTGNLRPDLLISEIPYDIKAGNETEYINSLVGYAEVKDTTCCVDDINWKDAIKQGIAKSKKLNMPYFMVTNLKTTYYYNTATKKELSLNGNPLREFCNLDILKFIKN